MASSNVSQLGTAGASASDPTVDLKTLVTALESLLSLAQSQIVIPSSESLSDSSVLDPLSINNSSKSSSNPQSSTSVQPNSNPGEPSSLPYVDGAISGTLEEEEERLKAWEETESHVRRKLIEIHSKLKNGCIPWDEDESMLLEQENASEKVRHRKLSHHDQQHEGLAAGNNRAHQSDDDEDEGETDEGTVSDPSPSPHLPKAPLPGGSASHTSNKHLSASAGPGSETAEAMISQCVRILDCTHGFANETKALAAQLLAELAKTLNGRSLCLNYRTMLPPNLRVKKKEEDIDSSVINVSVVEAVANVLGPDCPLETSVQICRILANLCFDCDEGRQQILKSEGCLKKLVEIAKGREERAKKFGEDPGQRLPAILPGFLLNFCNGTPTAIEAIGKLGFIEVVAETITLTKTNDAVFNNCLSFLNCLADEESSYPFLLKSELLPTALCHILKHTTSPEVTEYALELIQAICEQDNQSNKPSQTGNAASSSQSTRKPDPQTNNSIMFSLAKSSLCSVMMELITGRWQHSPDFQEHRTSGCNLLVLILSNDDSIRHMYENKKYASYLDTFRAWLSAAGNNDPELETCAALAIGNFACNETHCTELVSNGTSITLIQLLGMRQNSFEHLKLQHALLGALKNLAVAPSSRLILLEQGLLEPCLSLGTTMELGMMNQPVVYKLLATLRLSVDGHKDAACTIGKSGIIGRVVDWGANDSPPGIRAEATRLLAALFKHCHKKEIMKIIIECGGLPHIVFMLHSNHVVMLNEAIVALSIMSSTFLQGYTEEELQTHLSSKSEDANQDNKVVDDEHKSVLNDPRTVSTQLHTDAVINGIKNCLKNPDHPKEVKANAATLTLTLLKTKTSEFKQMLKEMNFCQECLSEEALKSLPTECKKLFDIINEES